LLEAVAEDLHNVAVAVVAVVLQVPKFVNKEASLILVALDPLINRDVDQMAVRVQYVTLAMCATLWVKHNLLPHRPLNNAPGSLVQAKLKLLPPQNLLHQLLHQLFHHLGLVQVRHGN
jgi:hypothetical protein